MISSFVNYMTVLNNLSMSNERLFCILQILAGLINPRRACAERVTVVVSCVCMSVRTRYSGSTRN